MVGYEKGYCRVCFQVSNLPKVKSEHRRPAALLQPLAIPVWKWDDISMNFMLGFPRTRADNDTLWAIVDRLTKSARFIPMNCKWDREQLARAYIKYVIRYYGIPRTIVSDRDTRYLSHFWNRCNRRWDHSAP